MIFCVVFIARAQLYLLLLYLGCVHLLYFPYEATEHHRLEDEQDDYEEPEGITIYTPSRIYIEVSVSALI